MEERVFEELRYLISYPEGFREDKQYPLVIFLHGAGTRGDDISRLQNNSCVQNLMKRQNERGYILLAPLCTKGNWNEWMATLIRMTDAYRAEPYIDKTRIHLTGNSMGGYGTWAMATLHPYWFASVMPICGGGIAGFAMNLVDLPIRTFHGLRDTIVDPIESLQMAKAVNLHGGHAELILFPELEHNCWDAVYTDEANYDWMLSFTARPEQPPVEDLSSTYYG